MPGLLIDDSEAIKTIIQYIQRYMELSIANGDKYGTIEQLEQVWTALNDIYLLVHNISGTIPFVSLTFNQFIGEEYGGTGDLATNIHKDSPDKLYEAFNSVWRRYEKQRDEKLVAIMKKGHPIKKPCEIVEDILQYIKDFMKYSMMKRRPGMYGTVEQLESKWLVFNDIYLIITGLFDTEHESKINVPAFLFEKYKDKKGLAAHAREESKDNPQEALVEIWRSYQKWRDNKIELIKRHSE